jgi:hypothetical protein
VTFHSGFDRPGAYLPSRLSSLTTQDAANHALSHMTMHDLAVGFMSYK